jgi:hypothetical protein
MLVGLIFSRRDVQRVERRRAPLGSSSSDSSAHEVDRVAELGWLWYPKRGPPWSACRRVSRQVLNRCARTIADHDGNVEIQLVVLGYEGVALLLHNTGKRNGRILDIASSARDWALINLRSSK